jgi:hypothetical protein
MTDIVTSREEMDDLNRPRPVQVEPQKPVRFTESHGSVPLLPQPGEEVVRVPRGTLGVQGRAGARTVGQGALPGFKRKRVARPTWSEVGFHAWHGPRSGRKRARQRGLAHG